MVLVSNSTALMHLPALGRLDLLRNLFSEIRLKSTSHREPYRVSFLFLEDALLIFRHRASR
ncbi:MAG: hypothetical protein GX774_06320 [Armatimonadetes bacterium]|jgi:predicted nucleic acid-binding protein|nr:hypothetical protein [Armatimonadota bacterium]